MVIGLNTSACNPAGTDAVAHLDHVHEHHQSNHQGLSDWTTINEEHYNTSTSSIPPSRWRTHTGRQERDGSSKTNDFVVAWGNEYGAKKTRVFSTTIATTMPPCPTPATWTW